MPLQNMKDIYVLDKNGGQKKVYLTLSAKTFEDIGDFNEGDEVEMRIMTKVIKKEMPTGTVAPQPASGVAGEEPIEETPDYNARPDKIKPETFVTVEINAGEVMNKKEDRKRAENLELDKDDLNEIQSKRGKSAMSDMA